MGGETWAQGTWRGTGNNGNGCSDWSTGSAKTGCSGSSTAAGRSATRCSISPSTTGGRKCCCEQFARDGVSESPYDYETINTVLLNFSRRMSAEAIAAEVIAAAEAADRAAAATPEAQYEEILNTGRVNLERAEHRRNHLDDIEAALSR